MNGGRVLKRDSLLGKSQVSFVMANSTRTNSLSFFKDFAEKGAFMITASSGYTSFCPMICLKKSDRRRQSGAGFKKDAQYYVDNINKVKDVDDFPWRL